MPLSQKNLIFMIDENEFPPGGILSGALDLRAQTSVILLAQDERSIVLGR